MIVGYDAADHEFLKEIIAGATDWLRCCHYYCEDAEAKNNALRSGPDLGLSRHATVAGNMVGSVWRTAAHALGECPACTWVDQATDLIVVIDTPNS